MNGHTLMFQGTASHVGKSVLCAAFCRILAQDGFCVAPFKSQNMALNSCVTPDGKEIGRAQGMQAEAAGVAPTVDMNPILIKPKSDSTAQVVVLGKPIGDMSAWGYREDYLPTAVQLVQGCLERLRDLYDVVVIEGAGSPAEINLNDREIVNMRVAKMADAPVILIGDIDRGGVFASLVGTLELLQPEERDRVVGFIINKFRGDVRLLESGLRFLEEKTGKPVLGVVPYLPAMGIDEEDGVALEASWFSRNPEPTDLVLGVVRFPRISNFTDLAIMEEEPGVVIRWVTKPNELDGVDAIILPGTKNTIADLAWLEDNELIQTIVAARSKGMPVWGICGGYQMLGRTLHDPEHLEGEGGSCAGLGLLDLETTFSAEKVTVLAEGEVLGRGLGWTMDETEWPMTIRGYEIHMGHSQIGPEAQPFCRLQGPERFDGLVSADGLVVGTYLHGIFDNDELRWRFLDWLRVRRGLSPLGKGNTTASSRREQAYDRLADHVRQYVSVERVYQIMGLDARYQE